MNLIDLVKGLLNLNKKIDKSKLPSQGLFYKDNFEIFIKRASIENIKDYEDNYSKNLGVIIYIIKKIVKENTIIKNYKFEDIKSIDIVFIFLEIVMFTKNKPIKISFFNDETGKKESIKFDKKNFNYFKIDSSLKSMYDSDMKNFKIDGYTFNLPSIGIENCVTNYLVSKMDDPDAEKYNKYNYDFTFFIGDKTELSFKEIENLIEIFNFDMEKKEMKKIKRIVKIFEPIQKYSLSKKGKMIEINSKIDLENIWK